jgi:hypothetical protein
MLLDNDYYMLVKKIFNTTPQFPKYEEVFPPLPLFLF